MVDSAGLETLDYAAIAFYLLLTFGIALWFGRRQKDTEDYFVGGRRMPWLAVGLSILATFLSLTQGAASQLVDPSPSPSVSASWARTSRRAAPARCWRCRNCTRNSD